MEERRKQLQTARVQRDSVYNQKFTILVEEDEKSVAQRITDKIPPTANPLSFLMKLR